MSSTLVSPVRGDVPPDVTSCEHCRTVTWAGQPACGCDFGCRAVDEPAVTALYSGQPAPRRD